MWIGDGRIESRRAELGPGIGGRRESARKLEGPPSWSGSESARPYQIRKLSLRVHTRCPAPASVRAI